MIGQSSVPTEINWILTGGATTVLLWVIFALIKGWLHTDKEFQRVVKDQEFYREMAMRGVGAAEQIGQVTREITTGELERIVQSAVREFREKD